MGALPLGFTAPLVLFTLLTLPLIWWLLRLMPPRPKQVAFPPTRLLADIERREETPEKSPWWLTLLRLLLATALIIALAGPIWRPVATAPASDGPLWLIVDNGWGAAASWPTRRELAERLLDEASRSSQPVLFAATADGPNQSLVPGTSEAARERLRALAPRSWSTRRADLTTALQDAAAEQPPGAVAWLTDDLEEPGGSSFVRDLAVIAGDAPIQIYRGLPVPVALAGARNDSEALSVAALRKDTDGAASVSVRAVDSKGIVLAESSGSFDPGAEQTEVRFDLPVELRNDVARLEIADQESAAGVQLLDDRWQRRTVGLLSGASSDLAQPLLSPVFYLERALSPFAELRVPRSGDLAAAVPELIEQGLSVMMLADVGRLAENTERTLTQWVENGGVLVRFAGPRMAGGTDDLIPTQLRTGGRSLGGSLSWAEPQPLAGFSPNSPFSGLAVPEDVTVNRQVLAEPGPELGERTWAVLRDGTPLVTAAPRGRGRIVLFHVTANTNWSNLPLSGVFVEMLRRIVASADAVPTTEDGTTTDDTTEATLLPPLRLLDGYGRFVSPSAEALPIPVADFGKIVPERRHPPGLYGTEDGFQALNLFGDDAALRELDLSGLGAEAVELTYPTEGPTDLAPALLLAALALLLADGVAMMVLRGDVSGWRRGAAARAGAIAVLSAGLAFGISPGEVRAQESSEDLFALDATLDTRLAYVITGDTEIDSTSRAGLLGLSRYLTERTALEPEAPVGVDIDSDELAFFPLLYWPMSPAMASPSAETMGRIDAYMRNGGTILFDTRDELASGAVGFGTSPATAKLREILEGLDIPPLEPVPPEHVLTKAFYLLDTFPGRFSSSPLWVEAIVRPAEDTAERPVLAGDGVSPIMITGNDLAGAWAIGEDNTFLYPTVPADPMQREYAYRAGVNIVMYALTGNYKADQVHVPALLERLGQ